MTWALLWWFGCVPTLDDPTPLLTAPRVLAVRAEPAEAPPGTSVALTTWVVGPAGEDPDPTVSVSWCVARKAAAELGPVAGSCLLPDDPSLEALGEGAPVYGVVPADACSRFGPNPPPPEPGEAPGRPTDPDVSGGYYQPVVVRDAEDQLSLGGVRLRCGLPNVAQETYIAWNRGYHDNANPDVQDVTVSADGEEVVADPDGALPVTAGAALTLGVSWPDCPAEPSCGDDVCSAGEDVVSCEADCAAPTPCRGAETWMHYEDGVLGPRREAITASWYVTGGELQTPRSGRAADDPETALTTGFAAPETPGEHTVAVVLRDSRGGMGFASRTLRVTP